MLSNGIIIVVLVVILVIALRGTINHMLGKGSCCGGGNSTVKEPDKKLSGPIIKKSIQDRWYALRELYKQSQTCNQQNRRGVSEAKPQEKRGSCPVREGGG